MQIKSNINLINIIVNIDLISCKYCSNNDNHINDFVVCNNCYTKYKNNECVVCLEENNITDHINLPCKHWVHKKCQSKFGNICVICRTQIKNIIQTPIDIPIQQLDINSSYNPCLKIGVVFLLLSLCVVVVYFFTRPT